MAVSDVRVDGSRSAHFWSVDICLTKVECPVTGDSTLMLSGAYPQVLFFVLKRSGCAFIFFRLIDFDLFLRLIHDLVVSLYLFLFDLVDLIDHFSLSRALPLGYRPE